jgi:hypothetical protein
MKKMKLNIRLNDAAVLTREQLKQVLGGFSEDGSVASCQEMGSACYGYLNCCNGLTCDTTTHLCKSAYPWE